MSSSEKSRARRPVPSSVGLMHITSTANEGIIMSLRLAAQGDPTDAKFQELRLQGVV